MGFAKKLSDEGHEVVMAFEFIDEEGEEVYKPRELLGNKIIEKIPLAEMIKKRSQYKDAYWIFDTNTEHSHYGEQLRKEGFPRVFGGRELTVKMEHDREFGVAMVERAGIKSPPTFDFKEIIDGIQHLDKNIDKAYVFKPNSKDAGWETYAPDSIKDTNANEELHAYLESLPNGNSDGYILQERIKGVEVNFEIWLHAGKPYFALCDLECKRKGNDDLGGLVGGAQDIAFSIPLESKAVRETVGKIAVLPEFKNYTGFIDANVIIADNGPYFLEFCARFGYPEHVTTFFALAKSKLGDLFSQMIDGKDLEHFYDNFKYGFGAGITLNAEKKRKGLPLFIPEDIEPFFYHYDTYKRSGKYLTVGLDMEVGVITGHGFTIMDAAEEAIDYAKKIAFPTRGFRTDLDKDTYASNPRDRYLALEAMRYLLP